MALMPKGLQDSHGVGLGDLSSLFQSLISAAVQILNNKLNLGFALCLHLKGLVTEWIRAQCTTKYLE